MVKEYPHKALLRMNALQGLYRGRMRYYITRYIGHDWFLMREVQMYSPSLQ